MCFWDCYHPFLHPCNMIRCVSPACVEAKVVVREFVKSQGLPALFPLLKAQPVGGGESRCLVVEPDHLQKLTQTCRTISGFRTTPPPPWPPSSSLQNDLSNWVSLDRTNKANLKGSVDKLASARVQPCQANYCPDAESYNLLQRRLINIWLFYLLAATLDEDTKPPPCSSQEHLNRVIVSSVLCFIRYHLLQELAGFAFARIFFDLQWTVILVTFSTPALTELSACKHKLYFKTIVINLL